MNGGGRGSSDMGRVMVAMSGGVDSSLAAALLVEQGYDVVGVTFRTHCYAQGEGESGTRRSVPCCSREALEDARQVCARLGIRHHAVDVAVEFQARVVDPFVADYLAGRTPNPCVVCNREIKFGRLLRLADVLEAQYLATGHYARVVRGGCGVRHRLLRGRDRGRDQSYVLWPLAQDVLGRVLFPLGELSKETVRAEAARRGLPVAHKEASQEICFVAEDYREFVRRHVASERRAEELPPGLRPGLILDGKGNVVGTHAGVAHYTLGQRKGLPALGGGPRYVVSVDAERRAIRLGREEDLFHREILVGGLNLVGAGSWKDIERADVQIRYRHEAAPAWVWEEGDDLLRIRFEQPQRAPTPGQSAVLYRDDQVLAGGVVECVGSSQPMVAGPPAAGSLSRRR